MHLSQTWQIKAPAWHTQGLAARSSHALFPTPLLQYSSKGYTTRAPAVLLLTRSHGTMQSEVGMMYKALPGYVQAVQSDLSNSRHVLCTLQSTILRHPDDTQSHDVGAITARQ